jgi:hypothetical protein
MRKVVSVLILTLFIINCSDENKEGLGPPEPDTTTLDATENLDLEEPEDVIDPSEIYPFHGNSCIECQWYFCPPYGAIWQKHICIDNCAEPPVVAYEGECEEHLECNPSQYLIEQLECLTEEGYPGLQDKVCNKGHIEFTDCVTNCDEETCDYEDNDCDGEIDEGQLNACGNCGIIPSEACNNYDDDCDGETDEDLFQPCSTACGVGYEMCDDGNWISCNAPPELAEVCDGLDNNCNGQIDEGLECVCTIQDVGVLFPCQEDPLLCGLGYKTCECVDPDCKNLIMTECYALCHWLPQQDPEEICEPLVGMELNKEDCNNFDDNCNQEIDEDLYSSCYSGPEGTLLVGICAPGMMTCDAGSWGNYDDDADFIPFYCKDEITPQEETCNGLDDDCDGVVDWGEEIPETDILFIVDWSGSMNDEISAVMIALNQFAQSFSDEKVLQWALIRGPVKIPGTYAERLELTQNLVGFTDFLNTMANMDTSYSGMSTKWEMLLDAMYLALHNITSVLNYQISDLVWVGDAAGYTIGVEDSDPTLQNFKVNWRPGADRIIIVFSDEKEQSFLIPKLTTTDLKDSISATPQLKLYTFSKYESFGWDEMAAAGNGKYFKLTNNPTEMFASLMEILDEICKGENKNE